MMLKTIQQLYQRGLGWQLGLAGALLIGLGSLAAGLAYSGRRGEAYSPLNHFVSELGEVGVSELAWVFNASLLAGGLCIIIFLVSLGARIGGWTGRVFGVAGAVCGVSGTLVGAFPMNALGPHIFWAMSFFNLGLLLMTFFSLIALFGRPKLPRWIAAPGVLGALSFALFKFFPSTSFRAATEEVGTLDTTQAILSMARPAVWDIAVFEWAAVGSVLVWAAIVAGVLEIERLKTPKA